jgi:membrane-bound lytic murein transglycosylase D
MKYRLAAVVVAALALVTCRSARRPPSTSPHVEAAPISVPTLEPATPQAELVAAEIEAILERARDGTPEDLDDCEVAIYAALAANWQYYGISPEYTELVGETVDELARLRAESAPLDATDEPPTDLRPVPDDRVAEIKQKADRETFDLPVVVNQEVAGLIDYYTGRNRERFGVVLSRAANHLPAIRAELDKAKLPLDLAYLPIVESGFNPRARSRARAQGMWQFITGTGRLYGLRADGLVDERNDPELSTKAAVRHLADLYAEFSDWELALAAYNSGAGRVHRAIRRAKGADDFWAIRKHLPRETRNYVPALWAALVVAKNPDLYGFPVFKGESRCTARVTVDGALDLQVLAERASLDINELGDLNPALVHRMTPARGSYQLAVPCEQTELVKTALAGIAPEDRIKRFLHVVRKGDTPSAIARQYGSTVDAIMTANAVKSPRSLRIGQTLVVPRAPQVRVAARPSSRALARTQRIASADSVSTPSSAVPAAPRAERYVVRRGDTLYRIARRFGTSLDELQKLNGLRGTRINPGDVLLLVP